MPPDSQHSVIQSAVSNAVETYEAGWTPIPIKAKAKMPATSGWTRLSYETSDEVREKFTQWGEEGFTNVGVLLGEASGGLIDVDLDHPKTNRLKRYFLPPTPMVTGRPGRPSSHWWYIAEQGTLPGNRRHKMPDGGMAVELRSKGSQTLLPPSTHPSGEQYTWDGPMDSPLAGRPARVDGKVLTVQVALLGLGTVLIDSWPSEGSRHEAYLALAGGMLRNVDGGVHPFRERNLPVLISALADATNDDDGADARVAEVMATTLKRIKSGELVQGFGKLGEILGVDAVKQARVLLREVESAAGYVARESTDVKHVGTASSDEGSIAERAAQLEDEVGGLDPAERDPLNERLVSWQPVDLEPYLLGNVRLQDPDVLARSDGKSLMYRGRVNMLFGSSESAKSWIALQTCLQEMVKGERVLYLDFEDEPISTLERLQRLGAGADDIRSQFVYVRPEEPLAPMQRNRWGQMNETSAGKDNHEVFEATLDAVDPTLIVADGMTVLYGLHGLDANDAVSTDVITTWLKKLTRNGRSSVIVIDHTGKGAQKGAFPIGSQHKTAMVQGSLLQVWPIVQPMPGRLGEVDLIVVKDRPGKVREVSLEGSDTNRSQTSAKVQIDSRTEGQTFLTIDAPQPLLPGTIDLSGSKAAEAAEQAAEWERRVLHVYEGELGRALKLKEILEALKSFGDEGAVKSAVVRLRDQGYLDAVGERRGRRYVLAVAVDGFERDDEEEDDD